MNEQRSEHQGGVTVTAGQKEQQVPGAADALPAYQNIMGAKADGQPQEVKPPKVRRNEAPQGLCLHKWVRTIIDRNGAAEELVSEAIKRVSEHHTEERLLEAQAVINELGRTGKHTRMLQSVLTADTIQSFLKKGK
jgi:hypothetical protein